MPAKYIPRADQSEQAVIGCLLMRGSPDEHAFDEIPTLMPDDFFLPECRLLFQACLNLHRAGSAIDQVLIAQHLYNSGKLESVGGPAFLIHCLSQVETSYHLKYYAATVQDCAHRRAMLDQATKLAQDAFNPVSPPSPLNTGRKGIPFAK